MNTDHLTLSTYLAVQLKEILACGDAHALTYAPRTDWSNWLQVSVHGGSRWHIAVHFPLPPHLLSRRFDRIFRQPGWRHWQADRQESMVYHLAQCACYTALADQA